MGPSLEARQGATVPPAAQRPGVLRLPLLSQVEGGLFGGVGLWGEAPSAQADSPSTPGSTGQLLWKDNWVTFLDTMLQMSILDSEQRGLRLPTRITSIHIDPATHRQNVQALQGEAQGSPATPALLCPAHHPTPGTAHPHSTCAHSSRRGGGPLSELHSGRRRPHLMAPHLGGPAEAAGTGRPCPREALLHAAHGGRVPGRELSPAGGAAAMQG